VRSFARNHNSAKIAMAGKKPVGRPPMPYNEEMADIICDRLSEGESLLAISREKDMPSYSTVLRWLDASEEFRGKYARARDVQQDYLIEEAGEIADRATPETVQVARLRCEQRRWNAAKLAPKKYGDRFLVDTAKTPLSAEDDETFYTKLVEQAAKLGFDAGSAVRRLEDLRSKTVDVDATED